MRPLMPALVASRESPESVLCPSGLSVVSIEGDHLNEIGEVLTRVGYVVESSFVVQDGERAANELSWAPDRNHTAKAAYVASGWTNVIDPELVLMVDDVWLEYSRKWNARIVAWLCHDDSGTYGMTVFQAGLKRREVLTVDGEVRAQGEPLPEEAPLDWSHALGDDVVTTIRRLGADFDFMEVDRPYTVFRLNEEATGPDHSN